MRGLERVNDENHELKTMLAKAESELRLVLKLKESVPEGCVIGEYCKACEFAKRFSYHQYGYYSNRESMITGIVCGKGESCKNFIQKEVKK